MLEWIHCRGAGARKLDTPRHLACPVARPFIRAQCFSLRAILLRPIGRGMNQSLVGQRDSGPPDLAIDDVPDRQELRRTIDFRLTFPYYGNVRQWLPYSIWIQPLPERGSHQCGRCRRHWS